MITNWLTFPKNPYIFPYTKKKQIQKAKAKIQKKHTTQKAKQGNNTPTKKSRMKPRTRERQKVRPVIEEKIWV
jgi:sRNA-binding protein